MKRILAALAAILTGRRKPSPRTFPLDRPMFAAPAIVADAADARATANWYIKTASPMQISRITELLVAMQNAVGRMRDRETTANITAARAAVKALQDYLKGDRDAAAHP